MEKDWIELLVTDDPLEAEMIKYLLESGGIPVVLRSSKSDSLSRQYRQDGRDKDLCAQGR